MAVADLADAYDGDGDNTVGPNRALKTAVTAHTIMAETARSSPTAAIGSVTCSHPGDGSEPRLSIERATIAEWPQVEQWAAEEGWNPGFGDGACFLHQDPDGFYVGLLSPGIESTATPMFTTGCGTHSDEIAGADRELVSAVSVVNYGPSFAFLGHYLVRLGQRGRGYGTATWCRAITHAGSRTIGLDAVPAQVATYRQLGFIPAYRTVRYHGYLQRRHSEKSNRQDVIVATDVDSQMLDAYESSCLPAPRPGFLARWIDPPGRHAYAHLVDGELRGLAVIRPARDGHRVGPLIAEDRYGAEVLLDALVAAVISDGTDSASHTTEGAPVTATTTINPARGDLRVSVWLDVPEPNYAAAAMAETHGMRPVSTTIRMYNGPVCDIAEHRQYAVTSLELG